MTDSKILGIFLSTLLIYCATSEELISRNYTQVVDSNIIRPIHIQLQTQTFKIQSQTTIPNIINPPSIIFPLHYSRIKDSGKSNCTLHSFDPAKKIGDYIQFQKNELGKFEGWPIQILDGAYSLTQQKMFVILTNGSIITAFLRKQIQKQNKVKSLTRFDYLKNQTQTIWQLDQYELYTTSRDLYILKERQLYRCEFHNGNQWSMMKIENGNEINKVHQYKDDLYIIKSNGIHRIQKGKISQSILKHFPQDNNKTMKIVDMSIDKDWMYILCRNQGIIVLNMEKNYQLIDKYDVDFVENCYKITVKNGTILLNFKLYRKTFIGQFFLITQNTTSHLPILKINKFYYKFDSMNKILLFQYFGIAYSLSQLNIFQHSINRYAPFGQIQTQQIYRGIFPKIIDIIPLDDKQIHYLLVQKNGVFVQSFVSQQNLFGAQVKCVFKQAGHYQVSVSYEGLCREVRSSKEAFCSKMNTYIFQVNNEKIYQESKALTIHIILILILVLCLIFVIFWILAYRRSILERQKKLMEQIQRRTIKNSDIKSQEPTNSENQN